MHQLPGLLRLERVSKRYGRRLALDDVSLEVPSGTIHGLLGPNGAGKTTLLRLVTGLLRPSAGRVILFEDLAPGAALARRRLGYMPQAIALYPGLSPRENVRFFGRLYGLRGAALDRRADALLDLVEISDRRDDPIAELSGGLARRAMLATVLVHEPRLVILDEPTAGVDPVLRMRFWRWFEELARAGTSILVTTHHLADAQGCHRVVFLREGRVLDGGTPDELTTRHRAPDLEAAFVRAVEERGGAR